MTVSLRKRYSHVDGLASKDGPPVSVPPTAAANLPPEAVVDPKPSEPVETKPIEQPDAESPVDKAAKDALRQRLKEMENAESLVRQAQQQPPSAAEPQRSQEQPTLEEAIAALPDRVQRWCRADSRYLTDPEKISQVQYCHWIAKRETGEEGTDAYFDRMDQMLGLSNGHVQAPRNVEPPRQQTRPMSGPLVSAPPTREAPSMTTGRVLQPTQVNLSADEKEIAWVSRSRADMTAREAFEEYARNKLKGQNAGVIGPGARDGR